MDRREVKTSQSVLAAVLSCLPPSASSDSSGGLAFRESVCQSLVIHHGEEVSLCSEHLCNIHLQNWLV